MAKLKAPLFSLGAGGALGKALVFFGWKGLNVVREYVVPSNPRTSGQTTQRGYLGDAVEAIHSAMAEATRTLDEQDIMAYALLASLRATPRTWFNEIVKQWLDQKVAGLQPTVYRGGSLTPAVDAIVFKLFQDDDGPAVTNGNLHYGTSKTALIHTIATTPAQMQAGKNMPGLVTGTKYFIQFRPTLPVGSIGANSGIYYSTPL